MFVAVRPQVHALENEALLCLYRRRCITKASLPTKLGCSLEETMLDAVIMHVYVEPVNSSMTVPSQEPGPLSHMWSPSQDIVLIVGSVLDMVPVAPRSALLDLLGRSVGRGDGGII